MMDQTEKDAGTIAVLMQRFTEFRMKTASKTSNWSNVTPNTRDWSPASWICIPKSLPRVWKTKKRSKLVAFYPLT